MFRPTNQHPRVFLGLLDICGFYSTVVYGLRELGVDAFFLDMGEDTYGHRTDQERHPITDFYKNATGRFYRSRSLSRFHPVRYFRTALLLIATATTIFWVALRFDVIVLKSGIGFTTNQADLLFFRMLGKKLIFTFHGSDARPPFINGGYAQRPVEWLAEQTHKTKEYVDSISKYATHITYNPLCAHFFKGKICKSQWLGHAVNITKIRNAELLARKQNKRVGNTIRILHAPSAPLIKGTDKIRRTIKKLISEGHAIDYVEISGEPHATVLREIARCDFVIDELYSDTHGAVFSLEACAFGKPSIVCGYGAEELARFVAEEDIVPTYYCRPEKLETATRKLLLDPELRESMGRRAKDFFERRATPRAVAGRLLQLATETAPPDCFFDPCDITYMQGIGFSTRKARALVSKLINYGGITALEISDKPELEGRFEAFTKNSLQTSRDMRIKPNNTA